MIAPLLPIAVSLIAGIVVGYYYPVGEYHTLVALAVSLVTTLLLYRWPRLQTGGIWICTMILGLHLAAREIHHLHTLSQSHHLIVASKPLDKGKTMVMDALTADGKKVRLRMMKGVTLHIGEGLTITRDIQPITYYTTYFNSHGYHGEVFVGHGQWKGSSVSLAGLSRYQRIQLRLLRFREHLTERYRQMGLADDAYAIVTAMTLGDKTALTPQLRDTYSITGASHILALSGLHLGIIYWLISLLVANRRWRLASQTVTILAIWAFAFLTGLSTTIIRSAIMLTIYSLLDLGYRKHANVNVLAFTATAMLVVQPLAVFDVGFQLSFLSVLSILLFYPLFYQLIPIHVLQQHAILRWLWGLAVLSLSAQLGAAPLVAYYFHRFSLWFLLTNFIVVPSAYLILYGSLLLLLTGFTFVATAVASIASCVVSLLTKMTEFPLSSIEHLHPNILQTALLYVAIGSFYVFFRVTTRQHR